MKKKRWFDYLWIGELLYLVLGLSNILFAWLGMLFFFHPPACGHIWREQGLLQPLLRTGTALGHFGRKVEAFKKCTTAEIFAQPLVSIRILAFFMVMFGLMLFSTYQVFSGAPLRESVILLWVFRLPWQWAKVDMVAPWFAQFAFGFFGVMLTSTVLGILTMILFRPRSWCVYCPMGTMTQGICVLKNGKRVKQNGKAGTKDSGAFAAPGK